MNQPLLRGHLLFLGLSVHPVGLPEGFQLMNCTGAQGEIHTLERLHAAERLADPAHLQQSVAHGIKASV